MIINSTSSFDNRTHRPLIVVWRTVASILLLVGLGWLILSTTVWGASEHDTTPPPANYSSFVSIEDISPTDHITEISQVFTLTVLSTNDTWGYLDPCG